jgi:hypothetical protein
MHGYTFLHDRRSVGQPQRRSPHRRRYRTALRRALAAARALRGEPIVPETLAAAAELHGVALQYVAAMGVIRGTEDKTLLDRVVTGKLPLLPTAEQVKARAHFVRAFRAMTPTDKAAVGITLSAETLFDECVVPAIWTTPVFEGEV